MTKSSKSKTVIALVVGVPALVVVGFLAAIYISLSGGIDDLFRGDPPREGDPEVVDARQAAAADLAADDARTRPALRAVTAGRLVGGGSVHPACQVGQHNWKIDDDFDLLCRLTHLSVVGADSRAGFEDEMRELHEQLLAEGWQERRSGGKMRGLPMVIEDYWRELAGGDYTPDRLPPASYERSVDDRVHALEVSWAERGSDTGRITYYDDAADLQHADGSPATTRQLLSTIPTGGYAVVLSETVEYFRG